MFLLCDFCLTCQVTGAAFGWMPTNVKSRMSLVTLCRTSQKSVPSWNILGAKGRVWRLTAAIKTLHWAGDTPPKIDCLEIPIWFWPRGWDISVALLSSILSNDFLWKVVVLKWWGGAERSISWMLLDHRSWCQWELLESCNVRWLLHWHSFFCACLSVLWWVFFESHTSQVTSARHVMLLQHPILCRYHQAALSSQDRNANICRTGHLTLRRKYSEVMCFWYASYAACWVSNGMPFLQEFCISVWRLWIKTLVSGIFVDYEMLTQRVSWFWARLTWCVNMKSSYLRFHETSGFLDLNCPYVLNSVPFK